MRILLPLIFIACVLATLIGCNDEPAVAANEVHDHSSHHHSAIESRDYSEDVPAIKINVTKDSASGWNLHIVTENFRFAPESVNLEAKANEGHAHIFVDGYKIQRAYGHWLHLKDFTQGKHTIKVVLNANDHSEWAHQGNTIAATATIIQN